MARVSSPVFVGRAAELDRLCQALDLATKDRPATRLIGGEAGIGKTRLVAEFSEGAREAGAHVLIGGCLQLGDTGLPYAPFVGALRPLLRSLGTDRLYEIIGPGRAELAHLLPDLGPAERRTSTRPDSSLSATAAQARLFEIVFGLLRRLVAELERLDSVDHIELAAFGTDELAAQLAGITGEEARPELVAAVLARSGGNPFFAEELMAAGEAGLALSRSLRDILDDRIRHLDADAQRVLRIASVAGERVDHRILAAVVDLPETELNAAIREAVEHHLLQPTPPGETPGYAFRHALLQEAVYEDLLPSERTQVHAAYAHAIEASPDVRSDDVSGTAALLAHHWLMAHDLERALPAALEAGRMAAAAFAFSEAQAYLERVLELWPKVPQSALPPMLDRTVILEEAAEAAAQAGDARRSIDLVRSALAETDAIASPMRAGVLQHRLAWYLNESGDWQSGVIALERAAELIPMDPPTPERARVLSDVAHSLMVRGRFGDSMAMAEAALAISRAVGTEPSEARALNALGLDLACRSDFERAVPILREGYAKSLQLGDPQAVFLTAVGLGWALDEMARHADSLELALATRDRLRELGAEAR